MKIDWTKVKEGFTTMDVLKEENKEQKEEIEKLNKRILTLEETIRKANNNVLKDIAMIKTYKMVKQEIVQRLIETSKILESGSDK